MPNVLVIHDSDATPILANLKFALRNWRLDLFDVQNGETTDWLATILRPVLEDILGETHICLVLSSRKVFSFLRSLHRPGAPANDGLISTYPEVKTFQLNLHRTTTRPTALWRDLFDAHLDPYFQGQALLSMSERDLDFKLARLADFLVREAAAIDRSYPRGAGAQQGGEPQRSGQQQQQNPPAYGIRRTVELLFATNRAPVQAAKIIDFTGERADRLSFGSARVHVPEDHKIGHLELPRKSSWISLRFSDEEYDPRRHFILQDISIFDQEQFIDIVERDPAHTAILFVHGFNTSFPTSVLRFAQIIWDMQFRSLPILFSWPSRGGVTDYLYDTNSALITRELFGRLIQLLRTEGKIETLHIIAHSMGNLVVLEALNELVKAVAIPSLSEIVMAAPDVDVDLFKTLATNIRPAARGMTLYASANDKALVMSRSAAKRPRAGDVFRAGPVLVANVESIDVSAIGDEMFGLNHNVFASNRSLIDDIGRLILNGFRPPDQRSPQIRRVPEGQVPPSYWQYAK